MAKYKDSIDLYDDEGKLLKSNVTIDKISPLVNKGTAGIIDLTKRTVAVNFAGIEDALKTGKMGGKSNQILGRSMNCSCVKDCDALAAKIKDMVQVEAGDDTKITKVGGGKMILVEIPTARIKASATYDCASTAVAAATTYALIDQYKVDMFDGSYVKGAVWGTYPQTMGHGWRQRRHDHVHPAEQRRPRLCTQEHPGKPRGHDDPPECNAGISTHVHL